jgi:hypothetical protein
MGGFPFGGGYFALYAQAVGSTPPTPGMLHLLPLMGVG